MIVRLSKTDTHTIDYIPLYQCHYSTDIYYNETLSCMVTYKDNVLLSRVSVGRKHAPLKHIA